MEKDDERAQGDNDRLEEAFDMEALDGEMFDEDMFDEEEEYAFEEEPMDDYDEEEEKFSLKPWMIPAFAGMLILAILICIPLWQLTHREKDAVITGQETGSTMENVSDTLAEESLGTAESADMLAESASGDKDGLTDSEGAGAGEQDNAGADAGIQAGQDGAGSSGSQAGQDVTGSSGSQTGQGSAGSQAGQNSAGAQAGQDGAGSSGSQTGQDGTGAQTGQSDASAGGSDEMQEPISGNASMSFQEVSDSVTAKDVTNLRSVPSTEDSENVVGQLKNGETLARTGINSDTGWSRLTLNGETVYAVTQYLTSDLSYKTPVTASNPNRVSTLDGRIIIFVDNDDYVTPKEYVNLRTEPSTSEGDSTVRCQVSNGENLHRTGYSPDSGWSRVEYNGEVLYVVSSLVQGVAAE